MLTWQEKNCRTGQTILDLQEKESQLKGVDMLENQSIFLRKRMSDVLWRTGQGAPEISALEEWVPGQNGYSRSSCVFHHLQIDCPLPVFIHKECSILCADCLEESDFRRYIIVFMESWPPTCFPKHINWGGRGARYNLPEDAYLINLSVFLSFAAHSFTFCWFFTICVLLVDFLVHDEPGFRVAQMTLKPKEL